MAKRYKQKLGVKGEKIATDFLEKKGYKILKKNYRYKHKEIDLIARDRNTIVFIEVKTGRSKKFGEPHERVDLRKRKKLVEVAQAFLQDNDLVGFDFRFDVVGIDLENDEKMVTHIPNAFTIDWTSP